MRHILVLFLAACSSPTPPREPPAPPIAAPPPADAPVPGRQTGAGRWKDATVYVDGRAVGVLAFGELPIALAPVFVEDEVSAPVKPGEKAPGFRRSTQRQYRLDAYLGAVGVDLAAVREVHVHGPKASEILIVSGDELRRRGDELRFRLGGEVSGKAIPVVPDRLGNGRTPDKISAVSVFVERTPPALVRNRGLVLDDVPVVGIAYAGEASRGGVRVYVDDRLAVVLKRKQLEGDLARLPLLAVLEAQGVDTRGLIEAWIIRDDRRHERLGRAELERAELALGPSAKATIRVDRRELSAGALAFHSRALAAHELPRVLPDEE